MPVIKNERVGLVNKKLYCSNFQDLMDDWFWATTELLIWNKDIPSTFLSHSSSSDYKDINCAMTLHTWPICVWSDRQTAGLVTQCTSWSPLLYQSLSKSKTSAFRTTIGRFWLTWNWKWSFEIKVLNVHQTSGKALVEISHLVTDYKHNLLITYWVFLCLILSNISST